MDEELQALLATVPPGTPPAQVAAFLKAHGYAPPSSDGVNAASTGPGAGPDKSDPGLLSQIGHMVAGLPKAIVHMPGQIASDLVNSFLPQEGDPRVPVSAVRFGKTPDPTPRGPGEGIPPEVAHRAMVNTVVNGLAPLVPGGIPTLMGIGAGMGAYNAPKGEKTAGAIVGGSLASILGQLGRRGMAPRESPFADRVASAKAAGVDLSFPQAMDSRAAQFIQEGAGVFPTGKYALQNAADRLNKNARAGAQKIASEIAGGKPVPTVEGAGKLAVQAAERIKGEFVAQIPAKRAAVTEALDAAFPTQAATKIPTNGELLASGVDSPALMASRREFVRNGGTLQDWAAQPSAAAPPSTAIPLSRIQSLVEEWKPQAAKPALTERVTPMLTQAQRLLDGVKDGTLSADNLLELRTALSEQVKAPEYNPNKTYAKRLGEALSKDLDAAATKAGPEAQAVWQDYNRHVQEFRNPSAIDNPAGADFWDKVSKSTPKRAFQLITNHPDNAAAIRAIRAKMTPDEFGPIAARKFEDLGQAIPSAQNAASTEFSHKTFGTKWNARGFTPEVRAAMFGDALPQAQNFADVMARVSKQTLPNPGGAAASVVTARQGAQINDLLAKSIGLGQAAGVGAASVGALPVAPVAAGLLTPYAITRASTSPALVRGIARAATRPRFSLFDAVNNMVGNR